MKIILVFIGLLALAKGCRVIEERANGITTRRAATSSVAFLEAFLGYETKYLCAGVLLSDRFVLTTASCVFGALFVNVHVNAHKLRDEFEDQREIHRATNIHFNDFDFVNHINDVAIIELPTPLNMTDKDWLRTTTLPTSEMVADQFGHTIGWGLLNFKDDNAASYLSANSMITATMQECMDAYPNLDWSEGAQGRACLKRPAGSNCVSDSGSPFFAGDGATSAIQSFGQMEACDRDGFFNGVQDIGYHAAWIKSKTGL
jgi:secreted trypsin-like serine protease